MSILKLLQIKYLWSWFTWPNKYCRKLVRIRLKNYDIKEPYWLNLTKLFTVWSMSTNRKAQSGQCRPRKRHDSRRRPVENVSGWQSTVNVSRLTFSSRPIRLLAQAWKKFLDQKWCGDKTKCQNVFLIFFFFPFFICIFLVTKVSLEHTRCHWKVKWKKEEKTKKEIMKKLFCKIASFYFWHWYFLCITFWNSLSLNLCENKPKSPDTLSKKLLCNFERTI